MKLPYIIKGSLILGGILLGLIGTRYAKSAAPVIITPIKPLTIVQPDIKKQGGNPYGTIMAIDIKNAPNTRTERIALYVPKHHNSNQTILRPGILTHQKNATATIIICHGFMTCKEDVQFLRQLFTPGKYNFLSFDFRAHGEQAHGQRCTFGRDEACEVLTAVHFLKHHPPTKNKPVILYAFSMGAVASIEAQAKDPSLFAAMVLDCPFDSSESIIKRGLDNVKFHFFGYRFNIPARDVIQKYAFHPYVQSMLKAFLKSMAYVDIRNIDIRLYPVNTAQVIHKVRIPCFFIHCKYDEKVSVDSVKLLYEKTGASYKKLWLTNGRGHYDSFFYNPEEYIKRVREFVDKAANGKLEKITKQEVLEDKPDWRQCKGYVWGIGKSQS